MHERLGRVVDRKRNVFAVKAVPRGLEDDKKAAFALRGSWDVDAGEHSDRGNEATLGMKI